MKRKKILTEKEWHHYLDWKMTLKAKKKAFPEWKEVIIKPLIKNKKSGDIVTM